MTSGDLVSGLNVSLDDKYSLERGRVYLTGTQALVRLPLMQRTRDRDAGLNTAGFISGYRGSPLGGYDTALQSVEPLLRKNKIVFQPGLNEDLAATSIWGTQQVNLFEGANVDGVFGIWYGKGPGADRCGDVFKHANGAGTAPCGGVLAVVGDDHGAHSSTMPHQSEQVFVASMMPVVAPATLQDFLDFGLQGFALSRYSGCWVGFKVSSQTVETAGTVDLDPERPAIVIPRDFANPSGGLHIRLTDPPLDQEKRLHGARMTAVAAFARVNRFDELVWNPRQARIGLVAAGKAYLDLREALGELGIGEDMAERLGIRLYKIGLVWPIEESGLRTFVDSLQDIIVVEEKRGLIEDQIARILYNDPSRPRIAGKHDLAGNVLIPSEGEIDPVFLGARLGKVILSLIGKHPLIEQNVARLEQIGQTASKLTTLVARPAFFCSGCPHNSSTTLPEGSRAMAGIGCHGMLAFMPERRTHLWSHMGGEGLAWVGQAPFTSQKHVFQNLGDGTYSHSGLLAIRAAAASKVNITYKILFNDAVAMTGGQSVEGHLTVPQICQQVLAEGAHRVVVVTDDPSKFQTLKLPNGIDVHHRDALDEVQRELRDIKGLTVLIYDQTCAAEKRRRRKRGKLPDPDKRVFINPSVCENCGDCTAKSNCISVQPVDTEFGRKRKIDQSSCNKDYSCVNGFCPSFVTVSGARPRKSKPAGLTSRPNSAQLPRPDKPVIDGIHSILITGIGGTGVITIGALLGMAARLDGLHCTVMDSTGMAQKNGAVMSHIRIGVHASSVASRIPAGKADAIIACDMVVAASPAAISTISRGATRIVGNTQIVPTAAFLRDHDIDFQEAALRKRLVDSAGGANVDFIDAQSIATALLGDAIATNTFMLGYSFQKGLLPVSLEALLSAIELNAVSVEFNKQAFSWGRLAAVDAKAVELNAGLKRIGSEPVELDDLIEHRVRHLTAYQDGAYARRYRTLVDLVRAGENAVATGKSELARAVAINFAKLMSYKDEYEVARLYTDGQFARILREQFEGEPRISLQMAPPFLSNRKQNGEPRKRSFGPWILPLLKLLSRLKRLRGTKLDVFGWTAERRMERRLILEYEETIMMLLPALSAGNYELAIEIACLPDLIRGFGHVKLRSASSAKDRKAALLSRWTKVAALPIEVAKPRRAKVN
ncbi:indolepyruvate ferredoxin oxidoreductase family protein [Bradyrhizobium sp. 14AA]